FRIAANLGKHLPGAGAALAFGHGRNHRDTGHVIKPEGFGGAFVLLDVDGGGDGDLGKILAFERHDVAGVGDVDGGGRLERGADALFTTLDLQCAGDDTTNRADELPLFSQILVDPVSRDLREKTQMDGGAFFRVTLQPAFFHGEDEDGREPCGQRVEQVIEHGQRRTALERGDRVAIERILADVEVERRELDVHEV